MNLNETLKFLCTPPGVAGAEFAASEAAKSLLSKYMPNASIDNFGNVIASTDFIENAPLLLLDAHIDEVGLIVNFIDENGFLKVSRVGGIDRRALPAAQVTVWGTKPLTGVVCALPPHVEKDSGKVIGEDEIAIDCGMSKHEIEKIISLGNPMTINADFAELSGNKITARALDDRAGIVAILHALELIKGKFHKYNLTVLFSSQEELGLRGAGISAFNIEPDIAISVDVSYGNYPGSAENKTWKLGGGVMIGCAPPLDRELFEKLKIIAISKNVAHQIEVMSNKTGTNSDIISLTKSGVKCALLSIPLRNMHTPAEVIQTSDVEAVGRLIAEFILGGNDV
jgi:endoglucanase